MSVSKKSYSKKYNKEYYDKNAVNIRAKRLKQYHAEVGKHLMWKYGITEAQYDAILASQNGTCAICSKTTKDNGRRLAVDHCHKTGRVRGILCSTCNSGIGKLQDSLELIQRAAIYLENSTKVRQE